MRTYIRKMGNEWWVSYTDKEGVHHYIASDNTKDELIHSMAKIIMRNDAVQEKTE